MKFLQYLLYYLFITICSIFIGVVSWLFLFTVNTILHFLWIGHDTHPGFLYEHIPLLITFVILGSLCLQFIFNRFTVVPKPGIMYAKELQENKKVNYTDLLKIYFLAMCPLILGSSVGPEAALVGILFMMSSLITDVTNIMEKKLKLNIVTNSYSNFKEKLFNNKLYFLKIAILYTVTTISLLYLQNKDHFEPFFIKLDPVSLLKNQNVSDVGINIIMVVIFIGLGTVLGKFYKYSEHKIEHIFSKFTNSYLKIFITSLFIIFFALFFPVLILSGEATLHILMENHKMYLGITFIILAILKIILTNICINGNLRGGHIFPIIFSSFLLGAGLSVIFQINMTLSITAITIGSTLEIFSMAFGVFLLLALFFPLKIFTILFVITLIVRERLSAEKNKKEL